MNSSSFGGGAFNDNISEAGDMIDIRQEDVIFDIISMDNPLKFKIPPSLKTNVE